MSNAAATQDSFVPFDAGQAPRASQSGGLANLKVVPKTDSPSGAAPAFTPLAGSMGHAHGVSGKPVVTLQREGERVTGIRIECICGQVIELTCSY